jgi:hypothetical protein
MDYRQSQITQADPEGPIIMDQTYIPITETGPQLLRNKANLSRGAGAKGRGHKGRKQRADLTAMCAKQSQLAGI